MYKHIPAALGVKLCSFVLIQARY